MADLNQRFDSSQTTSQLELNTFRKTLEEQLAAKDLRVDVLKNEIDSLRALNSQHVDTIKSMSASFERQNDTLQKQIGFRFNFVTSMMGVITLVLAATFVYNKYQNDKVDEARSFLEKGTKILSEHATKFADMLSTIAQASGLIADGNREYNNYSFLDAYYLAGRAVDLLEDTFAQTGLTIKDLRSRGYDSKHCKTSRFRPVPGAKNVPVPTSDVEKAFGGIGPQSLQPALIASLIKAYDLRNRARLFLLARSGQSESVKFGSMNNIKDDGQFLIALDARGWEGYHWVGLAAAQQPNYEEAVACYKQSVDRKPLANKDRLNLTELMFVHGDFPGAREQADAYLKALDYSFLSPIEIVAHFYLSISNFLSQAPREKIRSPKEYRGEVSKLSELKLEGVFSSTELKKYIGEKEFSTHVPDEGKRKEVSNTVECLLHKDQCK